MVDQGCPECSGPPGTITYAHPIGPGFNVGWIAAGRWQMHVEAGKPHVAAATAELPQLVLHEYLSRGSHVPHYRRLRHLLRERTWRVDAALQRGLSSLCRWSLPDGGYFLWLELPEPLNTSLLLEQPGLEHAGLTPGCLFSANSRLDHRIRINTSLVDDPTLLLLTRAIVRASAVNAWPEAPLRSRTARPQSVSVGCAGACCYVRLHPSVSIRPTRAVADGSTRSETAQRTFHETAYFVDPCNTHRRHPGRRRFTRAGCRRPHLGFPGIGLGGDTR